MKRLLVVMVVLGLGWSSSVLAAVENGGLAVSYVAPKGDFSEVVGNGVGLSMIFDYPVTSLINLSGSAGYYTFADEVVLEPGNVDFTSSSLWEFSAGPQVDFGRLYVGVEAGYYTNLDEWGLVPNIGIRKGMVDASFRYKMTDDGKFMTGRVGFFF